MSKPDDARIAEARFALARYLDCDDTEAVIHILKEDAKMLRVWNMARAAALEEAATECERITYFSGDDKAAARACARRIRALIEKEG